ncbi:MAG: SDR family oxidoreductase [Lewinellaceae bacterium]|nr:SDR family oxidoreductase [Phaeodactylibacter sp.]MCB9350803.1 SDR family oxidoreductase [Lewinellaceae bacterium]
MSFSSQVVWITGASSGIGEHLAYAFANRGAKLILSSRNEQELQRVRQNCPATTEIMVLPMDVTDFASLPVLVQQALGRFGNIQVLINNAGISQRSAVKDTLFEVDKKIMEVNFLGTVALTKAVLPSMLGQKGGQIVVISSVMGKIGTPRRSAYAASKHALHGYFDSLRAEIHEQGVKVTLICPGYVHTNVTINALTADGSANKKMAEATRNGMDPGVFAEKALRAIAREKEEVLIGGKEILGVYIKRFFPRLFSRIARGLKVS